MVFIGVLVGSVGRFGDLVGGLGSVFSYWLLVCVYCGSGGLCFLFVNRDPTSDRRTGNRGH